MAQLELLHPTMTAGERAGRRAGVRACGRAGGRASGMEIGKGGMEEGREL